MRCDERNRELHGQLEECPHPISPGHHRLVNTRGLDTVEGNRTRAENGQQERDGRQDHADDPRVGNPSFREPRQFFPELAQEID